VKNRALAILFVIVFIDLLGFGMVIPVMALYAERLGASETWTGLLSAGYSAMQFLFAPVWGRLSDRVGRRPVLLVSIAMTALAFLAYALAGSFPVLLASRLFAGAATANIAIAQAYVADVTAPEDRARGMGVLGAAFGMGFVLGPALGGLLSTASISLPGFAAAGLAALNGVAAFLVLPEPLRRSGAGGRVGAARLAALTEELTRKGVRRLLVIYLVTSLAFSAMESTFAFLANKRYGLDVAHVSWVFAYIGVIVAVVQGGLVGPLARRLGETRLLWVGLALQAVALLALPSAAGVGGLLAASAPLAVGSGLASPAMSALLSQKARAEDQGGTLGLGQSAAAVGRILGPEAGTFTFAQVSMAFPYLSGAALMLAAAFMAATLRGQRPEA
jgi:predicted MFS family arabinose efflux permease